MRILFNEFLISPAEDKTKVKLGNIELELDTKADPYKFVPRCGIVHETPSIIRYYDHRNQKISKRVDVNIEKGDKIYFHHFTVNEINKVQDYYKCDYEHTYCVIKDGEIKMLEDYVFVSPIYEDEANIKTKSGIFIKIQPDKIHEFGKVEHISPFYESWGLKQGDQVFFTKNSEYEMEVEGKKYYRMRVQDISCAIRDGDVCTIKGNVIVEQHFRGEVFTEAGILLPPVIQSRQSPFAETKVVSSLNPLIPIGETALYEKGRCNKFEFNGKKYSMVTENYVYGIIN